ncbi:MAG: hypothetical protein WD873_08900 [Candidatus Hydrogenedentales bacterium]
MLIVCGILFLIYAWRVTRDTHPMTEFVSANRQAEIFAPDLLAQRAKIAAFRGWDTLPEDHPWRLASAALNRQWDYPDWYLRNLVGRRTYISGNDAGSFSNAVVVTRMTSVGALLERLRRWLPGTEVDRAGGLNLRVLPDDGLYYAIRGRVLLLSPSRRALIQALTLAPEERANARDIDNAFSTLGAADLAGRFRLEPEQRWGAWLDTVSFALHIDEAATLVRYTAELRHGSEGAIQQLLNNARPVPLPATLPGAASIVVDFGAPVDALWPALGDVFKTPIFSDQRWQQWRSGEEGSIGPPLTSLAANAGPAVRVAWRGVSLTDLLPAPQILLTATAPEHVFSEWASQLSPPPDPADTSWRAPAPYFERESNTVVLPWRAGSDLTPAVSVAPSGILAVSSRAHLPEALNLPEDQTKPVTGNVHGRVNPAHLLEDIAQLGAAWAEAGMLEVESAEAFDQNLATWRERMRDIQQVTVTAACDRGLVQGDIRIEHAAAQAK